MMSMGEFPANYDTLSTVSPEAVDYHHRMAQVGQERDDALHERDDALLALRAVIGVIEGEHIFRPDLVTRNEGHILTIAKKALEAQTDG